MATAIELVRKLDKLEGQRQSVEDELRQREQSLKSIRADAENYEAARTIFMEASRRTQLSVKSYIEGLVTKVIGVFGRDYKFLVDFDLKKDRTECILRVQEGDKEPYVPREDQGGGLRDIIGFALRIVLSSLERPRSRPILVLDEPMNQMGVYSVAGGSLIKEISDKLGFQIIIITHDTELMSIGDTVYEVEYENGKSQVIHRSGELVDKPVVRRRRRGCE